MALPSYSLSSTSPDTALEDFRAICDQLRTAITTLRASWPHRRDYLTYDEWNAATDQHSDHLCAIVDAYGYFYQLARNAADAVR